MGLKDNLKGKIARSKDSEMDKWNDAGTVDWLSGSTPPPATPGFKLNLKQSPQSMARQQQRPAHVSQRTPEAAQQAAKLQRLSGSPQQVKLRQDRLRQAGIHQPLNKPTEPTKNSGGAAISININLPESISLPKLHVPKFTIPRQRVRKWVIIGGVSIVVGAIGLVALHFTTGRDKAGIADKSKTTTAGNIENAPDTPLSYKPLAPETKPNLASNDGTANSYDPKRQLYGYGDNFHNANLTVTQQPVPTGFASDAKKVKQAADSIPAKTTVETSLGTLYVGTDEKTHVQRSMLVYRDLLIFIMSNKQLDDASLKEYVESLH